MPGQGEQHKLPATAINPFEEIKPHMSEYTAQEIATLSSRLEKQLGPEYISSRPGAGGGKVHYLSADKCINLANEVFGFNGWSSSIQNVQIDFVDESPSTGKVSLGLSVIVRVTLRDGTYHEDIGYGHIENCKGKAAAFEKAKKEGTTDGLKRALRNFGNLLGNCVYDKEYVAKVTKLKIAPTKWDPENLHRHSDYAPVKKEPPNDGLNRQPSLPHLKREWPGETEDSQHMSFTGEGDDEFGSDDFDETDFSVPQGDHPDEVSLGPGSASEHFRRKNSLPSKQHPPTHPANQIYMRRPHSPPARNHSNGPRLAPQTPMNGGNSHQGALIDSNMQMANSAAQIRPPNLSLPAQQSTSSGPVHQIPPPQNVQISNNAPDLKSFRDESSNPSDHEPPVGFFTARAAESLQSGSGLPAKASAFNPHLDSPSIRKTAGVDHTKTKPVEREVVSSAITAPPVANLSRANFVNPQADKTRRLGMPGGGASPLQSRASYKLPSMKRPADLNGPRPALGDVTAASVNGVSEGTDDVKRQKVGIEPGVDRDTLKV